jgi:uncharacterized protein (TIGR03435 family)
LEARIEVTMMLSIARSLNSGWGRLLIVVLAVGAPYTTQSQTQSSAHEFEVASIKPNPGCDSRQGRGGGGPGRLNMECVTLASLIQTAYGTFADGHNLNPRILRVIDGPGWIDSEVYAIEAKANGNPPMAEMYGPMLQALLENRFKLKLHRDTREFPIYALTVAKSGDKLERTKEGSCTPLAAILNHPTPPPAPGEAPLVICGPQRMGRNGSATIINALGMNMSDFADSLIKYIDRPVFDRTNLNGLFDFHLEFNPDDRASASSDSSAEESIFTALTEQLGLKLLSDKGPLGVIVIDHVEKPSAN